HQDRRGVAPRLGLDHVRDDVRDRVGRRLAVARADVEHLRPVASGAPRRRGLAGLRLGGRGGRHGPECAPAQRLLARPPPGHPLPDRGARCYSGVFGRPPASPSPMLDWIADPNAWIALATLTALEIVLGIDNIIFI